jgi:hypothetical protein
MFEKLQSPPLSGLTVVILEYLLGFAHAQDLECDLGDLSRMQSTCAGFDSIMAAVCGTPCEAASISVATGSCKNFLAVQALSQQVISTCSSPLDQCVATLFQKGLGDPSGWHAQIPEGDYNEAAMEAKGVQNDQAGSIIVTGLNCRATLWQNEFSGWNQVFTTGLYDCCETFPNDETSSIQVHQQCGVSVYLDDHFSGQSVSFLVGSHAMAELLDAGVENDSISSIVVTGSHCQVT